MLINQQHKYYAKNEGAYPVRADLLQIVNCACKRGKRSAKRSPAHPAVSCRRREKKPQDKDSRFVNREEMVKNNPKNWIF